MINSLTLEELLTKVITQGDKILSFQIPNTFIDNAKENLLNELVERQMNQRKLMIINYDSTNKRGQGYSHR